MDRRILLIALTALAWAGPVAAQAPPPDGEWRTLRTEHFRVTFTPELEPLAREAAGVAERVHAVLSAELASPPAGPVDLVVTDHVDYTNGFARPFFSNRVVVYARPPAETLNLAYTRDWLEAVIAHELVHTFHLDVSGGFGRVVRALFGRVPSVWPVFPVAASPAWSTEGLATHYESRLTGAGRIHGSYHAMVVRTAALEDALPDLDDLSAPRPVWPAGARSYIYGGRIMRYIADTYGDSAHRAILDATAGSLLPTFLTIDNVAADAVGRPFERIYEEWKETAYDSARAIARRVRTRGITATTPVAGVGPYARFPRASPQDGRLAFTADDFRSDPATRLVDPATGHVRTLARRNQFGGILGPAAWLPDGSGVVVAQLERRGPYRAWSDLWRVGLDGREHRLTRGARLSSPDVAPDGRRAAAVRGGAGALDLVVVDLETGETRVLVESAPGDGFAAVRWSPDGGRIAASRYTGGRIDLVLVDAGTGRTRTVTADDAMDMAPAWSPDGRWLLWWSDRSGIPNVYAIAGSGEGPVRQVTNVLTGAIDPEVSPEGDTLYTAVYHHDGWQIEALPLDPGRWLDAAPSVMAYRSALLPSPEPPVGPVAGPNPGTNGGSSGGDAAGPADAIGPYSALPTLRPYFWTPTWASAKVLDVDLRFVGIHLAGEDVLARHSWEASGGIDIGGTGRFRARGAWTWRGLGNPHLAVDGGRDWDGAGWVVVGEEREPIFRRTDYVRLSSTLYRSRWRSTSWLRAAGEIDWEAFVPHARSAAELAAEDIVLRDLPTTAGASVGGGYSNAHSHPFSVSPQDGVSGSATLGRWWDLDTGRRAYDQAVGRLAGYAGFRGWGHADHVLAVRVAGLVRFGDDASTSSIGGVPGVAPDLIVGPSFGTSFLPVRGFDRGVRAGTRAWAATGEWRFPLHLIDGPAPRMLGFSLVALSGSLFVDVGNAECSAEQAEANRFSACADPGLRPLVSAGAEVSVDFGLFHNSRSLFRLGLARPLQGPGDHRPVAYVGIGRAF
jgi:Tol biopolymer transport system component